LYPAVQYIEEDIHKRHNSNFHLEDYPAACAKELAQSSRLAFQLSKKEKKEKEKRPAA
jgi:hypothetical protein